MACAGGASWKMGFFPLTLMPWRLSKLSVTTAPAIRPKWRIWRKLRSTNPARARSVSACCGHRSTRPTSICSRENTARRALCPMFPAMRGAAAWFQWERVSTHHGSDDSFWSTAWRGAKWETGRRAILSPCPPESTRGRPACCELIRRPRGACCICLPISNRAVGSRKMRQPPRSAVRSSRSLVPKVGKL